MQGDTSVDRSLADDIIKRVTGLMVEAEDTGKPLEIDPYRAQLFELFVTAHGAGYLEEDAEVDLTSDELCRELADRWGLSHAVRESSASQQKLPTEQLAKMRLLWSVMRMWMEWTYAWQRWEEFHHGKPLDGAE
ncbi:MAG: hypothetical protein HON53_07525 [Planctomycetaceae bacterium]|jgi:hypothetical protein|nr:hypothetical protein [Planctomycetaceae bacterium]MBT6155722.1 hypothetical protein [Planctomycetaceae bacterium]MBT6485005.1 hypothetical protein [Planctomycetaceae bacterium]MBT6497509.1 hypothetical protein [Planctomycetaceae bacterium]